MPHLPFDPRPGQPWPVQPGLRLLLARNASPMTERGTNTWLVGEGAVTVIDPGPADPRHLAAILAALAPGERVAQILVTHTHNDHSPLARPLAEATGAPVLAFGDGSAGHSARMKALRAQAGADLGGGESIDTAFAPDIALADGSEFEAGGLPMRALHTPGHLGNHLCFLWDGALFSGDHIMGWAPSLVSPPEGDLTDFMASLDRVEALGPVQLLPGHGAPVADGLGRTRALRDHRRSREAAIRAVVAGERAGGEAGGEAGPVTLAQITRQVYTDIPPALLPAAARNVLAHLIDLQARNLLAFAGPPGPDTPVHPL